MPTMKELGLDKLTADERLELIDELWDSLDAGGPPLTDAQRADLGRRLAEYQADPTAGSSWETVEARLSGPRS